MVYVGLLFLAFISLYASSLLFCVGSRVRANDQFYYYVVLTLLKYFVIYFAYGCWIQFNLLRLCNAKWSTVYVSYTFKTYYFEYYEYFFLFLCVQYTTKSHEMPIHSVYVLVALISDLKIHPQQ